MSTSEINYKNNWKIILLSFALIAVRQLKQITCRIISRLSAHLKRQVSVNIACKWKSYIREWMHAKMVACMRSQLCNENAAMKYDIIMQVWEAEDAFKRPLLIRRNNSSIVKQTLKNFIFMKQERNESMSSLNKAISSSCESSHNMKAEKEKQRKQRKDVYNKY